MKEILRESILAMVDMENSGIPAARQVTHGAALRIMERSLARTSGLSDNLRQHLAFRDLSDFISLSQKSRSNLSRPLNTDLLPVGNPMSTRPHAMTAAALRNERARWVSSDPRITTPEVQSLVAALIAAEPYSKNYYYYATRVRALPQGQVPAEALIASFGDGNSSAARSARARMQRRDRKGRFAWQGGGMSALVRRISGMISNMTGRMVGQGGGDSNGFFDVELADGRIARIPASSGESRKAYLPDPASPDGFATTPAKVQAGDPVIDEANLEFVDAPNGFRKDDSYDGPGTRYTDDAYAVTKYNVGDPDAPKTENPDLRTFTVNRVDNNGEIGQELGVGNSWADAQDTIRKDEPVRDKEEGRTPDPVALLSDEEYAKLMESGAERPTSAPEPTPQNDGGGESTPPETPAPPAEDSTPPNPIADEMVYDVPDGSVEVDTAWYEPQGRRNGQSPDYTDDPSALAQIYNEGELVNALREALSPAGIEDQAPGEGELEFNDGAEAVPADALYHALNELGVDADMHLATIYDEINGNTNNQDRLNAIRGDESVGRLDTQKGEFNWSNISKEDLPAAMQGMTDEEFAKFQQDGNYSAFLSENDDHDVPMGYAALELDPGMTMDAQEREDAGVSDAVYDNPAMLAMYVDQGALEEQLRYAMEPGGDEPGYGRFAFDDGTTDGVEANIPAENIRDALQLQGVDTNELMANIYAEGAQGQEGLSDEEAGQILSDLPDTDNIPMVSQLERDNAASDALALKLSDNIVNMIKTGAPYEEIKSALDESGMWRAHKEGYDERVSDEAPNRQMAQEWKRIQELEMFLNKIKPENFEEPVADLPETPEAPPVDQAVSPMRAARVANAVDALGFPPEISDMILNNAPIQDLIEAINAVPGDQGQNLYDIRKSDWESRNWVDMPRAAQEQRWRDFELLQDYLNERIAGQPQLLTPDEESVPNPEEPIAPEPMPDGPPANDRNPFSPGGQWVWVPRNPWIPGDREDHWALTPKGVEIHQQNLGPDLNEPSVQSPEEKAVLDDIVKDIPGLDSEDVKAAIDNNDWTNLPERTPEQPDLTEAPVEPPLDTNEQRMLADWAGIDPADLPPALEDELVADDLQEIADFDENGEFFNTPEKPIAEMTPEERADTMRALLEEVARMREEMAQMQQHIADLEANNEPVPQELTDRQNRLSEVLDNIDGHVSDVVDNALESSPDQIEEILQLLEPVLNAPDGGDANYAPILQAVDPEGNQYDLEIVQTRDGLLHEIWITDAEGRRMLYSILRDPRAANFRRDWLAGEIGNGNYNIADIIWRGLEDGQDDSNIVPDEPVVPAPDDETDRELTEPQRLRRERGLRRRPANGANNKPPRVPILERLRNGRDRAQRGRGPALRRANDLLRKLHERWDSRGNHHPRPEHEIAKRTATSRFDHRYTDINGNIIKVGDHVVHYRAAEVVNPDAEAVNLIQGVVIDRGHRIRNNGRRYDGYLTVRVTESDDPEWVGRYFTYRANRVEIIRQPDLQPQIEADIAARGESNDEMFRRHMWNADTQSLYAMWSASALGPDRNPHFQAMVDDELRKRNLLVPQDMADWLDNLTDEGIDALEPDIASTEGYHGHVLRKLIQNERNRRARGESGHPVNIPPTTFDPGQDVTPFPDRPVAPRPAAPPPAPAAPRRPRPPRRPAPAPANPPPPAARGIGTDGLDPRNIPQRFFDVGPEQAAPQEIGPEDAHVVGVQDDNFDVVHPQAPDPSAVQADYVDEGWDAKRAAEIAEAARSRASLSTMREDIARVVAIQRGTIEPDNPHEALDLEEDIKQRIRDIFGINRASFGEGLFFNPDDSSVGWDYAPGSRRMSIYFSGKLTDNEGRNRGTASRQINIDMTDPSRTFAYNALFRVNGIDGQESGGSGASDAFNRWMENWYIANGIPEVRVEAYSGGTMLGGARWALNGFQWERTADYDLGIQKIRDYMSLLRPDSPEYDLAKADWDKIQSRMADGSGWEPTPLDLVMIGWRNGIKKDWAGWNAMSKNLVWHGKKTLKAGSTSDRNRTGYETFIRKARSRAGQRLNVYTGSEEIRTHLSTEANYNTPDNAVIAPFRDELIPFFQRPNGDSLARLSPPARQALQLWSSRELERPNHSADDIVPLIFQLREEAKAYDTTIGQDGDDIPDALATFKSVSRQNITDVADTGEFLTIQGQATPYQVERFNNNNVMDTYKIFDTESGAVYFAKLDSAATTHEEVNDNALARALGMRGAAYVVMNGDEDVIITSYAGNGIRNAVKLDGANRFGISSGREPFDNFNLPDVVSMALLDAVIANTDRHHRNWLVAQLDNYGVQDPNSPDFETMIPLVIDHGHASSNSLALGSRGGLASNELMNGYRGGIYMFGERMRRVAAERRGVLIRTAAENAIERLKALRPPSMANNVYDTMISRLQEIRDLPADQWRF